MEKDTINYMKYKMGFSRNILLAYEAVPTKFHCQDRKRWVSGRKCLQNQNAIEVHAESIQKHNMVQDIVMPEGM